MKNNYEIKPSELELSVSKVKRIMQDVSVNGRVTDSAAVELSVYLEAMIRDITGKTDVVLLNKGAKTLTRKDVRLILDLIGD